MPRSADEALVLAQLRPGAGHEQASVDLPLAQPVVGLEQMDQPLALLEAADKQDVERAVAKVLVGLGPVNRSRSTPFGMISYSPGKYRLMKWRAAPETAIRPCEPLREPSGEALPDPVRRAEAAEGMEGGDVHRPRLVEHRRREERNKRFVEVEDVEIVRPEHVAGLALEAQAERHAPHRAIGRGRPAGAEADDVALALALAAVLRGDDPHVMAHVAQRLVRESDVFVDPARMRVPVGAYDSDLEQAPRRRRGRDRWRPGRRMDRCHRHSPVGRRVWRRCLALARSCLR